MIVSRDDAKIRKEIFDLHRGRTDWEAVGIRMIVEGRPQPLTGDRTVLRGRGDREGLFDKWFDRPG